MAQFLTAADKSDLGSKTQASTAIRTRSKKDTRSNKDTHRRIARTPDRFQTQGVRPMSGASERPGKTVAMPVHWPLERESDATVAIFVFSYFRAFVIDSISSHHNSFHDKRRGVEVEEQADAEARCAEIVAESGSKSWPMGVPPDRSRKHESTKTRRNLEPELGMVQERITLSTFAPRKNALSRSERRHYFYSRSRYTRRASSEPCPELHLVLAVTRQRKTPLFGMDLAPWPTTRSVKMAFPRGEPVTFWPRCWFRRQTA